MWHSLVPAENGWSPEVVLVPTDTLLRALRLMEQRGVCLLPVVEEERGVVGLISQTHILLAWQVDPLLPVGRVMAVCGVLRGERVRGNRGAFGG